MKIIAQLRSRSLSAIAGALALFLLPAGTHAATPAENAVVSKLDGATILNSPAPKLISAVRDCVKENPKFPTGIVIVVLKGGRADTDAIAPQVTAAAIEGLGSDPSQSVVGDIISASVKAAPAVVLETVRASVKVAPGCAKAIVRAAVKAVPNPKDKIAPVAELLPDGAQGYAKDDSKDSKDLPEVQNQPLPIAEAIAQAAYQGDPGLSYQELLNAANQASTERAGGNFTVTSVYPGFYYPPLVQISTGVTPTTVPTPPVVSK